MSEPRNSETITTLFESPDGDRFIDQSYKQIILRTLEKILPIGFFSSHGNEGWHRLQQAKYLRESIPILSHTHLDVVPGSISFFLLAKFRPNAFKFFFEMISRWLNPGSRLDVVLVYATDFRLTDVSEETYTMCEVRIHVRHQAELTAIEKNYPIVESEIALGIPSAFYAHRILEIKGLYPDEKTALVHETIAYLVKRFPKIYERDVFEDMQHILVNLREDFKKGRQVRHLTRIISSQYFFKKLLKLNLRDRKINDEIPVKVFPSILRENHKQKNVLCLVIGVILQDNQEPFGENHLYNAVKHLIASVRPVDASFFTHRMASENIFLSYMEVEKESGDMFSFNEVTLLKKELSNCLKNRIEYRIHSVFMPRNEEEVMRNIVTLADQIRFLKDIPQVCISFDEQAFSYLYFTVVVARLLRPDSRQISELFSEANSFVEYIPEQIRKIGHVRKKYLKEASVFRLKLPKDVFLRADHSIDLYKARKVVVDELRRILGEFRDYNGGMLSRQHEMLASIRVQLKDVNGYEDFLLENFFYSLTPVVTRALIDPYAFKVLFQMLLNGLKDFNRDLSYRIQHQDASNAYALVIHSSEKIKDQLLANLKELSFASSELACANVKADGYFCVGFLCFSNDETKRKSFLEAIQSVPLHSEAH